jgi:hypothetical protein
MKRESAHLPKTLYAASALALVLGAGWVGEGFDLDIGFISDASAAEKAGGQGGKAAGPGGDVRGGKQQGGKGSSSSRGGKSMKDVLAEEDEDSDRPPWAGGKKELNPHRGTPNPTPGVPKGDDYGDLWVILRDDLGNPILDTNGQVQPILIDGTIGALTDPDGDGKYELPPELADLVQAVEIGRSNVTRAPDRVITHSLEEALSKLDGLTYSDAMTDPAGRLMLPDGSTIDSPLENLALYQAVLTAVDTNSDGVLEVSIAYTGEAGSGTYTFLVPTADRLDLAAALLAAGSDKTATLSVDRVVNVSLFLGVLDDLQKLLPAYTYDGAATTYAGEQILVYTCTANCEDSDPTNDVVIKEYVNLTDKVTFTTLPKTVSEDGDNTPDVADSDGITGFTQAADDALQVIEYVHDNAVE